MEISYFRTRYATRFIIAMLAYLYKHNVQFIGVYVDAEVDT